MIDLHSHILYGLDDGSRDLQMTLDMLAIAVEDGTSTMVATPHYMVGANQYDGEILRDRYNQVLDHIDRAGMEIDLLLGHELYLDECMVQHLEDGQALTLGNTSYVLFEFPMGAIPLYTDQVIYGLLDHGYKPIIAHPERYIPIQEDPNLLIKYIEMGCITQINTSSINGVNGKRARQVARLLLENNMGHLVATDSHSNRRRRPGLSTAYGEVVSWLGREKADRIFFHNPRQVVDDERLILDGALYIKRQKSFFKKHLLGRR